MLQTKHFISMLTMLLAPQCLPLTYVAFKSLFMPLTHCLPILQMPKMSWLQGVSSFGSNGLFASQKMYLEMASGDLCMMMKLNSVQDNILPHIATQCCLCRLDWTLWMIGLCQRL